MVRVSVPAIVKVAAKLPGLVRDFTWFYCRSGLDNDGRKEFDETKKLASARYSCSGIFAQFPCLGLVGAWRWDKWVISFFWCYEALVRTACTRAHVDKIYRFRLKE